MKTNFKKLAILAGATAAMAAGSMSAQAVITSVPAPAQLIPLFYYNTGVDTSVRVIVPKSVGADTVINLLGAPIGANTSWSTAAAGVGAAPAIHRFFLNYQSREVINDKVTLTPDDELYWNASSVAGLAPGVPYYVILTNESAALGGTPTFTFAANAWIENDNSDVVGTASATLASTVSLPVLGLADTADTTTYPTPTNNVIENYPTSAGGPIASPIISGIRTSSTAPGLIYRVIDVPVHNNNHLNTLVAWADQNASSSNVNGLSGKLYSLDRNEVQASLGTYSFPYQLNIVKLGYTATNPLGIIDTYAAVQTIGNTGSAVNGGFLKLVGDADSLPAAAATLAPGAYSSVILFTIPADATLNIVPNHDASEIAFDTGFFTQN